MARNDSREANPGKGSNAGQGLANIGDDARRGLAAKRQDAPLKDQGDKLDDDEEE